MGKNQIKIGDKVRFPYQNKYTKVTAENFDAIKKVFVEREAFKVFKVKNENHI